MSQPRFMQKTFQTTGGLVTLVTLDLKTMQSPANRLLSGSAREVIRLRKRQSLSAKIEAVPLLLMQPLGSLIPRQTIE